MDGDRACYAGIPYAVKLYGRRWNRALGQSAKASALAEEPTVSSLLPP